ncbi:MAG: hypothetical protein ACMG55_18040 [Microcoleus sp.]
MRTSVRSSADSFVVRTSVRSSAADLSPHYEPFVNRRCLIYFGFTLDIDINVKVYDAGDILSNQIFP